MMSAPLVVSVLRAPDIATGFGLPQWDLLIRQARRANLLARLASLLRQHGLYEQVPPAPRQHLAWSEVISARHAQAVRAEVGHIGRALGDTPLVLLKGAAYAMAGLPHAAGRLFSDIDILVPKQEIDAVENRLMVQGWMATHHDAYDQRYYRDWMHEIPPLKHVRRQSVIDVHHAILPLTMRVRPDSDRLRAAAVTVAGAPHLRVLAPADMLLHSAAHLFYEGELFQGLRDLADLDALLRHFSDTPGFWERLAPRARELELTRCLFYALRYTGRLLGTPVPAAVLDAAGAGRPPRAVLALMDALYDRVLLPEHRSCTDGYTALARKCIYVRANWLRMPPVLLARHLLHKAFISKKDL